jgi:hypothetical protein
MSRLKSVWLLLMALAFIGRAEPLRAQALTLPIGPTLNGALGVNTFTLQASGGTAPYHYSITPGFTPPPGFRVQDGPPLPTNFTVGSFGTGGFLGVAATSGTFTTSIRATDATAAFIDKPITLNIPPLQFSINPPKMTLNVAYSYTFTGFGGSGGSGYSWLATNLPTGINLSPGGVLSGTPTAIPVGNAIVTLTDSTLSPPLNSLQRQVTITVDPFAITTPGLLPNATAGVFYSQTIAAPGCPAPCSFTPTSFAGLTLNSAGVLSGTPFLQTGSFTVTATGAGPVSVSKQFTLFVSSSSTPLSNGFFTIPDQTFGNFATQSILPFGGTPPYTVSLVSGTLPTGISLVGPGDTVCNNCNPGLTYLAGRALQLGTFNFTLKYMDSVGASFTPAPYTWNISALSSQYFTLPLAGTTLAVGTFYSQPLLVIGGTSNYSFQALSALPAGLSLDTNTGVVSGTPTTGGGVFTLVRFSDGSIPPLNAGVQLNVSGPPTVVTLPATNVSNTSARLNGTYNPAGFSTNASFQWGTTIAYGNTAGSFSASGFNTQTVGFNISISCVAGSVYHYRLVASNSQGTSQGADQVFTCSPQVFTSNADNIGAFTARLNGSANPNGLATTGQYQWGLTNAYGNVTPPQSLGAGTNFVFIDGGTLTGLTCSTTYHFRAVASNPNGTSVGSDVAFTTNPCSPSTFTGVATVVGQTSATFLGAVNPNGQLTNAHFQWGATTAYGNVTPDQAMGSGFNVVQMATVPISGLTCGSTYHFRAVATNSFGTAAGFDRAFTTAPCVATAIRGTVYALEGYSFTNLIYGYGVTSSGALVQIPGFPVLTGGVGGDDVPEQLTYDPAARRLYAINSTSNTLSAFSVNTSTGALTPMPFSPIALPPGFWTTVRVHPSGSPVIVGGVDGNTFTNGRVASYAITPTTATPAAGSPYSAGVDVVYASAFSRDGSYVYAGAGNGNPGNPTTAGFSVNPGTGVLTPLGGSPFTLGGVFPIGYATDTSGRIFAANNEGNQVRVFTTSGGVPTAASGSPFPAGGLNSAIGGVLHPAGFYMVPDENSGRVGVFQIAGSGSGTTLTNVAGSPFATGGGDTIGLAVSKDGKFAFALNAQTRNLTVFSVNTGTGGLTTLSVQAPDTLSDFGFANSIAFAPSGAPSGDFDGDGKSDITIYRPSTGLWATLQSSTNYTTYKLVSWGVSTDTPVPGDYDGDGKADLAVYRPSTGFWYILQSSTNFTTFVAQAWGTSTDVAVPGDYDGDGKTDLAVYRPSTGVWYILQSSTNFTTFIAQAWGTSTDVAVPGDYDGDGKTDLGVYRPSTGVWYILQSSTTFIAQAWGTSTDVAVPGDYDGDGKTDLAIFRPSTGTWWILQSSTNFTTLISQTWGTSTDTPVNHRP